MTIDIYSHIFFTDPTNKNGTYGLAEIEDVRISECPDSPCKLKKGTSTTIEFDFKPGESHKSLRKNI
jgi:hypothetical protein